jgi:hypothetical protein
VFIDTIQQTYEQIYLPNDININLQFCFYEIDTIMYTDGDVAPVKQYSPGHVPRYAYLANSDMHLAHLNTPGLEDKLLIQQFDGTIKQGLYTPQSLAETLTKLLSGVVSPQHNPYSALTAGNPFIRVAEGLNFYRLDPGNNDPLNYLAPSIDYTDYYSYLAEEVNVTYGYWTGARQIAVLYDDQGDNKFQFIFHTPCYDDEGNVCVKFTPEPNIIPGNPVIFGLPAITRDSGVMFLDIQPRSFWQSLGFNVDSMLVKFTDINLPRPTILAFNNETMTSEALFTVDDFFGYKITGAENDGTKTRRRVYSYKTSNYIRGVYASQFYSFKTLSPFLLVEFLTNFNGTYLTGNDKNKFISAVVSRNYTQNNYVTGYSDSSIAYQHRGESFILSSIRTRILSPDTKDVSAEIGPNNYIIVNVMKNS